MTDAYGEVSPSYLPFGDFTESVFLFPSTVFRDLVWSAGLKVRFLPLLPFGDSQGIFPAQEPCQARQD